MSRQRQFPDISDIIARKAKGRHERAQLSFGEKLDALDKLREQVEPIVRARRMRRAAASNADGPRRSN
jgi:hypothetical protein